MVAIFCANLCRGIIFFLCEFVVLTIFCTNLRRGDNFICEFVEVTFFHEIICVAVTIFRASAHCEFLGHGQHMHGTQFWGLVSGMCNCCFDLLLGVLRVLFPTWAGVQREGWKNGRALRRLEWFVVVGAIAAMIVSR